MNFFLLWWGWGCRDQAERESRLKKYAGCKLSTQYEALVLILAQHTEALFLPWQVGDFNLARTHLIGITAYESQSGSRDRGDPAVSI